MPPSCHWDDGFPSTGASPGVSANLIYCRFSTGGHLGGRSRNHGRICGIGSSIEGKLGFVASGLSPSLHPYAKVVPTVRFCFQDSNWKPHDRDLRDDSIGQILGFQNQCSATARAAPFRVYDVNNSFSASVVPQIHNCCFVPLPGSCVSRGWSQKFFHKYS
jgi:hypothetical protein